MYEHYWGLTASPFQRHYDSRWFYESPVHEESQARLLYLIEQRKRCGLLSGQAGMGKSLLLHLLAKQVRRTQRQLVFLDALGRTGEDLTWELAAGLHLAPDPQDSLRSLWRRIQDHLRGLQFSRLQTIVVVDHFDQSDDACLPVLQRLAHLDSSTSPTLTFLVAARSSTLPRWAWEMQNLSDLRLELLPWDLPQTHLYVHELLGRAGRQEQAFERAALDAVYQHSRGIPQEINRLCDLSLLAGMGEQCLTIDADLVDTVANELQLRVGSQAA